MLHDRQTELGAPALADPHRAGPASTHASPKDAPLRPERVRGLGMRNRGMARTLIGRGQLFPALLLPALLFAALLVAVTQTGAAAASDRGGPAYPHRDAAPPIGFGNIPFGTEANAVLALNNGNGTLVFPGQGPAVFRYGVVLAGLQFQVTQNFDDDNRAINAQALYASGEEQRSCIARFNYILAGLNARYGPPTVIPDVVQELRGGNVVGSYAAQYDFNDRTSIRATVETLVPVEAGGAGGNCQIALNYYPPGWLATF